MLLWSLAIPVHRMAREKRRHRPTKGFVVSHRIG